ncbi:MAG: ParB/RepB/Spo0J family partition protein [Oscillospiraceae bacterium]|jgi:ParB family chromosome partitioning protein|nr:ParB/RepB/Spo0J family partition protein [Oscillospiraceae bacterium]
MKKNSLGRGLGALLPGADAPLADPQHAVTELPLGQIDPNRDQPRKRFDEEGLRGLAASIAASGVIQPILVYQQGERYTIIAGERRWRAARLAGLDTIPAIVRDYDRVRRQEVALIENIQRENLNPMEEAAAVRTLMDECGLTQESVAQRLGRSRPAVANLLRVLTLPETLQKWVREGTLSAGHARALAGVQGAPRQQALAERAVAEGWSVRQLERATAQAERPARPAPPPPSLEMREFEEIARRTLGVRAAITGTPHKGRIVLTYASAEELEAVYAALQSLSAK